MKNALFFFSFSMVICLIFSCRYDKGELMKSSMVPVCDTAKVSYQNDVLPILQKNCYTCHSNKTANQHNTIDFEGYAKTKANTENADIPNSITPGPTGRVYMPRGIERLSDCDIAKIRNWMKQGTPDN
jgi:mono/diheme cytochrome c family protein